MAKPRSVCVYCGSSAGRDPAFLDAAIRLGEILAREKIELVYGGGSLGMMGAVAEAALKAGGHVTGIIPKFLDDVEKQFEDVTELYVTHSMHERKQMMFERSDAFIGLPGGMGTLEEMVEVMAWGNLGVHAKPMVLVDIHHYWAPLTDLIDHMIEQKFLRADFGPKLGIVPGVEKVLAEIDKRLSDDELAKPNTFDKVF